MLRPYITLLDPAWTEPLPIYAWVIEHPEGVIVVDTGETARVAEPGYFPRWHPYFQLGLREWVRPEEEIGPQLRGLGVSPADVRWVLLTHFHTDHAGGLPHFPRSEIVVSRTEHQAASGFRGQRNGYLPQHWPAWFAPHLIDFPAQPLGPFPNSYPLTRAGDVHLVPTPGHTSGHFSVIVQEDEHTLFFAGDTSYTQQLLLAQAVDGVTRDIALYQQTAQQIRTYLQSTRAIYLPSHDPESAHRLEIRTAARPVNA